MIDFIWFFVGFGFGALWMMNRKEIKDRETFEQVDARVIRELEFNKTLVESLKKDLAWAKQRKQ
jgi:hypothetical protein